MLEIAGHEVGSFGVAGKVYRSRPTPCGSRAERTSTSTSTPTSISSLLLNLLTSNITHARPWPSHTRRGCANLQKIRQRN